MICGLQSWQGPCDLLIQQATPAQHGTPEGGNHVGKWYGDVLRSCPPFFQVSRRSLAYQCTINAPLMCPSIFNFRKILHFLALFWPKCQLSFRMQISQIFVPKIPNFSRKIRSLDPTFGNPCGTHPPKKLSAPQDSAVCIIETLCKTK